MRTELIQPQSLLAACGIRKQWAKEYEKLKLRTDDEKVRHLQALLREAGLEEHDETLEAARAVGQQRKMAKEAAELGGMAAVDESASNSRASRKSKSAANER